jgi:hypothetical protein
VVDFFLIYLIIGVLLTWLTDYMTTKYAHPKNRFNTIDKAILVVIWPYNLFLLVKAIIKVL